MLRVWCLRHLEVIGEASSRLSNDMRSRAPEVPWREIIGMRNILIHGYFDIDWDAVWVAANRDVPALLPRIKQMLQDEGEADSS